MTIVSNKFFYNTNSENAKKGSVKREQQLKTVQTTTK